ncbi:hypothetical protein BRDID11002_15440 [Bradyrhizobium diazoefficiens]
MRTAAAIASGVMVLPAASRAADLPLKAPALKTVYDWTGLYIGAHVGVTRGTSSATLIDPTLATDGPCVYRRDRRRAGGLQLAPQFGAPARRRGRHPRFRTICRPTTSCRRRRPCCRARRSAGDYVASLRARLGYTTGNWLFYATGGAAFTGERFLSTPTGGTEEKVLHTRFGWTAGGGVEYAFAPHWSARLEYLYSKFDNANVTFPSGAQYSSSMDFQSLRIGLNRKIDWPGVPTYNPKSDVTDTESSRWEIHGQSTVLGQGYPAFHAPYTGTNSLLPSPDFQQTWSNSLYLNARLWDGGEVYFNPELLQGFGFNNTTGRCGLSQRRSAEVRLPLSALQRLSPVRAPHLRLRRRTRRACQRAASAREQS